MGFWDWFLGRKSEGREEMHAQDEDLTALEEEDFWAIIEESLPFKDDQEEQLGFLEEKVEELSPREIAGFEYISNKLLLKAYRSDLWCAAYVIKGGCGDNGFDYFRSWLISKGLNHWRILETIDSWLDDLHPKNSSLSHRGREQANANVPPTGRGLISNLVKLQFVD